MAEQERKVILKVETGDSQRTVKSLKQEISDLKDSILNLEKGSDDYNDAVKQLTAAQRDLNEVQALTKRTATALDGSYDALVHKMSQLKKEWRATADVAKRAEIGEEIGKINGQLKDLDAEIGNYQRNVGNYVSHWEGMPEVTKDFGTSMREMSEQLEPTKMKFESVANIASGVAGGFAAVQGAMALLGVENENLEQTFVKLQAAMAIAQGVGGLSGLVEGVGKAKVAFGNLDNGVKALNKTMGKTGWLAVILAIITAVVSLITYLNKKNKAIADGTSALKEYNKVGRQAATTMSDEILKVQLLEQVATDVAIAEEHRTAAAKELLRIMGKEITDTNTLAVKNGDLKKEIDGVTASMIKQAMAAAQMERLMELYKEYLSIEEQGVNIWDKLFTWDAGALFTDEREFGSDRFNKRLEEAKTAYTNFAKTVMNNTDVADLLKALGITETKGNGGGDKPKTAAELLAEASEALYNEAINMEIEDVPIEIEEPKSKEVKDKRQGHNAQFAKNNIGYYDGVYQREMAMNEIAEQSDKERYERRNQLLIENEEKKLDILKRYYEKALEEGDFTSRLDLEQEIANQEVAILVEKNRQKLESEERTKEQRIKILNDVSSAIAAAGSLTESILQISQAAAEKDGKITEKEAKRIKGMQYATASINMLQGAITAFSSAMQLGPILGPIVGGVNAAAVIGMGTANLMKIKNTDITGDVPSGAQAAVTPNSNVYGTDLPFSYTRNVTTSSEVDELNKDTRVYILESDIQESNSRVQIRESESSF